MQDELERSRRLNVELQQRLAVYEKPPAPVTPCGGLIHHWATGSPEVGQRCSCGAVLFGFDE